MRLFRVDGESGTTTACVSMKYNAWTYVPLEYNNRMELRWSDEKAKLLKEGRNIDVRLLAELFLEDDYIDSFPNQKNPHQTVFIFNVNNYALIVICVADRENEGGLFLKTAYYNRNYTELYKLR